MPDVRVRWRPSSRGEVRRRPRYRSEGENPGGQKAQESYVPVVGLNSRRLEADSRVEQTPVGEGGQRSL